MRIDRVKAVAFGPFTDETLELAPGMTVVHGLNESGKSSWHAALYVGLCGMRRGRGAPLKADRLFAERHSPWDGGSWRVGVAITLDDGRSIQLTHDLAGLVDCRATDMVLGTDVSDEIMFDGSPDGAAFLGLTRKTLPSTLCIRQADLLGLLGQADELQEALQRAAATGGTDATAEQALGRIDAFRRDKVGTERANATKPLMAAVRARHKAVTDLAQAKEAHEAYLALTVEHDRAARAAKEARHRLDAVRAALAVEELAKRVAEARTLWDACDGTAPMPARDSAALDRQVAEALSAHHNRPAAVQRVDGASSAELEAELAGLPEPPVGDVTPDQRVLDARRRWERTVDAVAAHPPVTAAVSEAADTGGASAAELRQTAEDLEIGIPRVDAALAGRVEELRRTTGQQARQSNTAMLGGAGAILVAAVIAGVVGQLPVAGLFTVLGIALGAVGLRGRSATPAPAGELHTAEARLAVQRESAAQAQARRDAAAERAAAWGLDADATRLRALASALADAANAERQRADWQQHLGNLEDEAAGAAEALLAALGDRGAGTDADDPAAAVAAYVAACAERATIATAAARRDDLTAQLAARRSAEDSAEEQQRLHQRADRLLVAAAAATSTEGNEAEGIARALETWERRRGAQRDEAVVTDRRWQRLELLLDGDELSVLEAELERRRTASAEVGAAGGAAGVGPDEELPAQLDRLEKEVRALDRRADELEGQISDRRRHLPVVAEAEEEFERVKSEERRLRALDATLATAHRFLSEAKDRVHRDIAPKLQASVAARLPGITAARYEAVTVDPATLEVKVREAGGTWRLATLLSHGTAEQVYLLLRLAMAEHLCTIVESAPLLLDDVTVQADTERTQGILDLLHDISAERQVVLFSQEEDVLAWAERRLTGRRDRVVHRNPVAAR